MNNKRDCKYITVLFPMCLARHLSTAACPTTAVTLRGDTSSKYGRNTVCPGLWLCTALWVEPFTPANTPTPAEKYILYRANVNGRVSVQTMADKNSSGVLSLFRKHQVSITICLIVMGRLEGNSLRE